MTFEDGEYYVTVLLTTGPDGHRITSPGLSQQEAERSIAAIQSAKNSGDTVDLDWLRTEGVYIISAHVHDAKSLS